MDSFEAWNRCVQPPTLLNSLFAECVASLQVCLPRPGFIILFPQVLSQLPPHPWLWPWANCFTSLSFIFLFCKMRIIAAPAFAKLFWESNAVIYVEVVCIALCYVLHQSSLQRTHSSVFQGCGEGAVGTEMPKEMVYQNPQGLFQTITYLPYPWMCLHTYIRIHR